MNNLKILCYHGVTKTLSKGIENYNNKHINYKIFKKQIKKIKKYYNPISMDEVIMHKRENIKYPKNTIAITFDDGFKNNYDVAAPILDEHQIPATFYISTGYINSTKMFWVDQIEDCINRTKVDSIVLKLNNKKNIYKLMSRKQKISSLISIKKILKQTNIAQKEKKIKEIIKLTRINPSSDQSENYKKLTKDNVIELSNNRLFLIGSHSVNHESMRLLNPKNLKIEIRGSIKFLSKLINKRITHYSYPEGQLNDFSKIVINEMSNNNIECCPTALQGSNSHKTDLFKLKRYMIGLDNKLNII